MQSYKKYYIPYRPKAKINYIYLLCLYRLAERPEDRGIKQDIDFLTYDALAERMGKGIVSASTLRRIVKDGKYQEFLTFREFGNRKSIVLNNDFRETGGKDNPFVVLCPNTYNLLIQEQDNLLAKYTIYMKYTCGMGKGKADFTANQFLNTFGYKTNSNDTKEKLCRYNALLEKEKIVSIYRTPLEDGKRRNIYTFLDE